MAKKHKEAKKPESVEETPVSTSQERKTVSKSGQFYATARQNVKLPNGTFVAQGEKIKVSKAYVERLRREKDNSFIITQ